MPVTAQRKTGPVIELSNTWYILSVCVRCVFVHVYTYYYIVSVAYCADKNELYSVLSLFHV